MLTGIISCSLCQHVLTGIISCSLCQYVLTGIISCQLLQGTISIGAGTQVDFLPDTKSHQRRFRILDSQTQVPYEICTPDVTSLQQWNNGIQVVSRSIANRCNIYMYVCMYIYVISNV